VTAHRPALPDPVGHVMALLATRPQPRLVLGLAGLPGAGKSTLGRRIAQEVNDRAGTPLMQTLGMDGFHLSRAALAAFPDPALALRRRGAPWTFDPAGLAARLRQLHEATRTSPWQTVPWPGFEHGVGDPVEDAIQVGPEIRVVLVEGLYLLHQADGWNLDGLLDECWYLDVGLETATERLLARHMASWSLSREQAMAKIAANDRLNAELVEAGQARADWRVR
jgi:pantothenate kinase